MHHALANFIHVSVLEIIIMQTVHTCLYMLFANYYLANYHLANCHFVNCIRSFFSNIGPFDTVSLPVV